MKNSIFCSALIIGGLLWCSLLGCSAYQSNTNLITNSASYPRVIEQARKDKRYFIMHSGVDTFAVTSLLVEKTKQQFTVHLDRLDSLHRFHFNNPKALGEKRIYLHMRDSTSYTLDEPHTIPLARIANIELTD